MQLKVAELDTNRFNLWSTLGFNFSLTCSPLVLSGYMAFNVGIGGSPYFFWCFLVVVVMQLITASTLAELASVFPHTSGQMFWTCTLAPPKYAPFMTYFNGIMTTLSWVFGCSGTLLLTSNFVLAFARVVSESFSEEPYQAYLLSILFGIIAILTNTVLAKFYPYIMKFMIVFLNCMVIFLFVSLLVKTNPKASTRTAFIDVVNETGRPSNGLVFFLGFLPGLLSVCMLDTPAHMAEEVPRPHIDIPRVMVGSAALSAFAGLIMVIALIFCTTHPENILELLGGQPILQILWDAWNNKAYIIATCWINVISFTNGQNSMVFAGSRIVWSFSESGGLPFRKWLSYVDPRYQVPTNAVILFSGVATIITTLTLGASTVLNGIYGAGGVCTALSYGLPLALIISQRHRLPERRYFNLGGFGLAMDIVALCWQIIIAIFVCFPLYLPVAAETMNWASVCAVIAMVVAVGNWFLVSGTFELPRALYVEALHGPRATFEEMNGELIGS
ncbi:putative amino acid transporter [Zopfia rhizophila CBS 207.26]|uniref:Putative amino acid transporter n=1 Tax=Zopfia rhizophila CBS 207.26 TaxID=1314779 RepID=A0A6A6DDR9_9PEZI|nr:putative amino acid transporter [Zopfia rhizophila CBS 207.26]